MKKKQAHFQYRLLLVVLPVIAVGVLLAIRLIDLQLLRGGYYRQQADNNRYYSLPVEAARGIFIDRFQDPLVLNQRTYYRFQNNKSLYSSKELLSREEALPLLATDESQISVDFQRKYLYPESLSHVLGYIGEITADDVKEGISLPLYKSVGRAGLEKLFDPQLQGIDGQVIHEINAAGQRQRVVEEISAQSGKIYQLTIDPFLSEMAHRLLGESKGVVIINDAQTGALLTLVSRPAFDPNVLANKGTDVASEKQRRERLQQWFSDTNQPFFNRAVAGVYPPGSIFKLVTALAGLENEKITKETTVNDEGVLKVGEYEFGNWYFTQYGRVEGELTLTRALSRSNDIYFYKVAEWVGPDSLAQMARLFGLGTSPHLDWGVTAAGTVPDPLWKEKEKGEKWFLGNTYHYGIGQGDLLVSPLQIAEMLQAIANHGTMCQPTVLLEGGNQCHEVGVKEENLELVLQGMIGACSPGGTAYPFFPINEQRIKDAQDTQTSLEAGAVACKTGTAEFGGADERGYRKTHAWFAAIVEPQIASESAVATSSASMTPAPELSNKQLYEKWRERLPFGKFPQRLTMTVLVESDDAHPFREGSADAAPIAQSLLDWIEGRSK